MPANTSHKLPYPLPTEPVAEGAQAIRNLAEAVPIGMVFDQTLVAAAASIQITAIPPGYRALMLTYMGRSNHGGPASNVKINFNADGTGSYDTQRGEFNATNAYASDTFGWGECGGGLIPGATAPAGAVGIAKFLFPYYSNTVFHKHFNGEASELQAASPSGLKLRSIAGRWRNTAAINQIGLSLDVGQWIIGSRVTLYVL